MKISNLFVSYELAKLAKKKGFDEPCIGGYTLSEPELFSVIEEYGFKGKIHNNSEGITCAPLYQQLVDWLYKEHGIWITIKDNHHTNFTDRETDGFRCYITVYGFCEVGEKEMGTFKTHYEAITKALGEAFTLI